MTQPDDLAGTCGDFRRYAICLQGHLDSRWSEWLEGLAFELDADGTTRLTCPPVDQATLHGLLARIRDLGTPIVSVTRICTEGKEGLS